MGWLLILEIWIPILALMTLGVATVAVPLATFADFTFNGTTSNGGLDSHYGPRQPVLLHFCSHLSPLECTRQTDVWDTYLFALGETSY